MERGKRYNLLLRYTFQPQTVTRYTVIVQPYWWNTLLFRAGIGLLILTTAAALTFWGYKRKQTRRFALQEEQREKATLALRSIQSQLNPHFIFNALNSIQSLVNAGDIDGTNRYLTEFSALIRVTLTEHDRILHRLGNELKSMEIYLRLEQLRFHFQYHIHADPALEDAEIPLLLLQPIIENAVRHGVSALREQGVISIMVTREGGDLRIAIRDNGAGFPQGATTGYGLKLTYDRIRLLNQMYGGTQIELVGPTHPETTFTFVFKNWLS